ncbi:hypothetical protein F2Q69_00029423 [Brassica cretica]|uniref:Uncharacterized protein n=1 Tax=Brassica cretica TaxID=69181 RepID=A0A8S9S2G1_BRACR|nr:hypothetical protein F2Q69_00029423 [Brassica cretica]
MGLDVAFIKHGLTLNNHGRPVTTLIDKEMDRMKLVRQEMEWEIQSDREMDWSNRDMRELSCKWKIENQRRKWNMMRTFIIQMSIRSSLVGPGTRWIEPKKELFEKDLYRPKKWKDKPAWIIKPFTHLQDIQGVTAYPGPYHFGRIFHPDFLDPIGLTFGPASAGP